MPSTPRITPCLWFDGKAEEAATFYTSIFKNSRILDVLRYSEAGQEIHGKEPGTVMTVSFEIDGEKMTALNGGPEFRFTEAVSFEVNCDTQEEIDYYWEKLSAGGDEAAQQCGWLKDKYGLSWQIIPTIMPKLFADPNSEKTKRTMDAMLKMKKLDIAELEHAYEG